MKVLFLVVTISLISAVNVFACIGGDWDPVTQEYFNCPGDVDELVVVGQRANDQVVQQDIIEDTLTRETATYSTGEQSVAPSGRFVEHVKVLNIPYSYALNESVKISVNVPFIKIPGESGLGNVAFTGNYIQGSFDKVLWQSSLTIITPTGDKEVGAVDEFDFAIAQSALKNFGSSRVFGTISYLTVSSDFSGVDPGDIVDLMIGADKKISDKIGVYGHLSGKSILSGDANAISIKSQTNVDTTVGVLYTLAADQTLRFGVTVPTVTNGGNNLSNSDRDTSFDIGMRFAF